MREDAHLSLLSKTNGSYLFCPQAPSMIPRETRPLGFFFFLLVLGGFLFLFFVTRKEDGQLAMRRGATLNYAWQAKTFLWNPICRTWIFSSRTDFS